MSGRWEERRDAAIGCLRRLKADFKMAGANATTMERAIQLLMTAPSAARPSPTGEKVEAVAWLAKVLAEYSARSEFLEANPSPRAKFIEAHAASIAALVAEWDEARRAELRIHHEKVDHFEARIAAESALAAANARVERLEAAMKPFADLPLPERDGYTLYTRAEIEAARAALTGDADGKA